jgi:hypothetical protein
MASDTDVLQYYGTTPTVYQINTDMQPVVNELTEDIMEKQTSLESAKIDYQYGSIMSTIRNKTLEEQQDVLREMEGIISNKTRIVEETEQQLDNKNRQTQFIASVIVGFILLIPAGILLRIRPAIGYALIGLVFIGVIVYYFYVWSGYQAEKSYNLTAYETAQNDIDTRYEREMEEQGDAKLRQEKLAKLCACGNPNIPPSSQPDEEEDAYDQVFKVYEPRSDPGFTYMDSNGPVEMISPPMTAPDAYGTVVQRYGGPVVTHHYTIQ